jgi:hypothetical protein
MSRRLATAAAIPLIALAGWAAIRASSQPSPADRTEAALQRALGATPIFVGLTGQAALPANLVSIYELEQRIARLPGVRTVYGPGTFVARTAVATEKVINAESAAASPSGQTRSSAGPAGQAQTAAATGVRMGFSGRPSVSNWSFVSQLVLGAGVAPKPQLAWLFPDSNHAVITVLLGSEASRVTLGERIAQLVVATPLAGVSARVAGSGAWSELEPELHIHGGLNDAVGAAERTRALFAALAQGSAA